MTEKDLDMKRHIRTASLAALVALSFSCARMEERNDVSEYNLVPVEFTLDLADVQGELTKASSGLFPEVENWIFDYYFVQFSSRGVSVVTGHRRTDVSVGDLVVKDTYWLYDTGDCTVAFIANISPYGADYGDDPQWKTDEGLIKISDNILGYQAMKFDMSKRLAAAEDGTLKHMPMCGYWKGSVTTANNTEEDPFQLTATLGRMMVRMNINVTNSSAATITSVALENAAAKAYLFPQVHNTALAEGDYTSFSNPVSIAPGASGTVYFYTAPNFCDADNASTLVFTADNGKTATVKLGNDLSSGDYNLYMNTIYTFNLDLK